ncbi:MAG TPA: HWE histidine kinase domain-containing protein [Bauldia sp.]|nr:HWE histidine kinase domain-containing protein [Bauldia sp.]
MHQQLAVGSGGLLPGPDSGYAALYRLTDRLYRARNLADVYDAALDTIVEGLGCGRASVLLFDETGVMRFVAWRGLSQQYRERLAGHSPWKPGDLEPQPIFVEDIEAAAEPDWVKAAIRAEGIRGLGFIPLLAQGRVIGKFMTYYEHPHAFDDEEIEIAVAIARQIGFSLERVRAEEARLRAEEDLRESEERFRLMAEQAPVMIWISDANGKCQHLNTMLRTFWNVSAEGLADFDWTSTMHPEDAPRIGQAMMNAIVEQKSVRVVGRYLNNHGEYRFLQTDARPNFSARGVFRGMIGVNVDITEREEADAQRELLLAELNHRVKNTLAVVQAIAHQTFKGVADAASRGAFEARLAALAGAHNLLTQANWESASLKQIAADAFIGMRGGERVAISGPEVRLKPKEALAVAMALHELCTNAVKYGALSTDTGRVIVEWRRMDGGEPKLQLTWREEGGPRVSPPERRGFGTHLIGRTLAADLDGRVDLDFRPEGLVCTIEAPASRAENALG